MILIFENCILSQSTNFGNVYAGTIDNQSIYVVDAQPNAKIQVFEMNGKIVASGTTDANGSAEIKRSASKGVCVVTDGNQSTKVVIK